jgi:hypothetical protein
MAELTVDEFGMNFHMLNFKPQMDESQSSFIASFS